MGLGFLPGTGHTPTRGGRPCRSPVARSENRVRCAAFIGDRHSHPPEVQTHPEGIRETNSPLRTRHIAIRKLPHLALEERDLSFREFGDMLEAPRHFALEYQFECFQQLSLRHPLQRTCRWDLLAGIVLSQAILEQPLHRRERESTTREEWNSIRTIENLPLATSGRRVGEVREFDNNPSSIIERTS